MKTIPLTRGMSALVDDADFEWLSQFQWHADKVGNTYYAVMYVEPYKSGLSMHRLLLQAPKQLEVDHADHNGLNNQRLNLRLATRRENAQNAKKAANNTSGFKGVSWCPVKRRWRAQIMLEGRHIHLGYFRGILDAAKSYDAGAQLYFGEFAATNKSLQQPTI